MFALVGLSISTKLLQSLGLGDFTTYDRLVFASQLQHLCLNLGEVALLDHLAVFQQHIVEESVVNGRSESELNARIKSLQSLCQQVGGSVPERVFALIVIKLVERDGSIGIDGAVQLDCLTIYTARYNVAGESR